jgi:hypothetical protein
MARGAKPGERRGGRKAGTPNHASRKRELAVAATGVTPLDIMLHNARTAHAEGLALAKKIGRTKGEDNKEPLRLRLKEVRAEAQVCAKQAADFIHPKLQSVMHATDPDNVTRVVLSVDQVTLERMALFIRGGKLLK